MTEILQALNLLAVPGLVIGYIVVLERRLTKVQTQLDMILQSIKHS
jgi:hypothetical protein